MDNFCCKCATDLKERSDTFCVTVIGTDKKVYSRFSKPFDFCAVCYSKIFRIETSWDSN